MPLPAGFKVNGLKVSAEGVPVPPLVKKVLVFLDSLPSDDLLTTGELATRVHTYRNNIQATHPALQDYREKVDGKLFWGNPKSIKKLRAQLAAPEETDGEDQ